MSSNDIPEKLKHKTRATDACAQMVPFVYDVTCLYWWKPVSTTVTEMYRHHVNSRRVFTRDSIVLKR
jgi:hypothetical protein